MTRSEENHTPAASTLHEEAKDLTFSSNKEKVEDASAVASSGTESQDCPDTETPATQQWTMDTSDFPSSVALIWIVAALLLAMFIQNLDATIIATAIPRITDEFNSVDQVGWYGSAFFLTFASFQSTWGKAFKYFPLKATFLLSLFLFELGSLIIALAPNSAALIIGRAIAGAGAAGVSSGVFTIIAFAAPQDKVPAFVGTTGATYVVAAFIGPLLGGVFAEHVTW